MVFAKDNLTQTVKVIFFSLLIISLLSSCNQGNRTKTESDGQNKGQRVVVTNSDAFEILVGLGASENIVGISSMGMRLDSDNYKQWPSIGHSGNPNIEAITDLKPDVVITYKSSSAPADIFDEKLNSFNISVERINCFYMSEYHSDVSRLGALVGKENMADTMIHDFDKIVGLIKNAVADVDVKKSVYIEFADFTAMGAESGNHEMIELANATNIASKLEIKYPKISTEWLLEENPDIIIKIIRSDSLTVEMYDKLISRAGWNKLDAVKNKQVFLISYELCPGPRSMIGSLYFGKWCYPEKFESIDPDSIHAYWMKKYYGETISDNRYVFSLKM